MIERFLIFIYILLSLICFNCISCKTSQSSLNIIEGNIVEDGSYPTVVLLKDKFNEDFVCTGIVVSENVVLTAAHCILNFSYSLLDDKTKFIGENYSIVIDVGEESFLEVSSDSYIYPDKYVDLRIESDNVLLEEGSITRKYQIGSLSRDQYEKAINSLKHIDNFSYDIGAIIFKNKKDSLVLKKLIDKAKEQGSYFSLSKTAYKDGDSLGYDKKNLFFLGFGVSGKYKVLTDTFLKNIKVKDVSCSDKKQIGYNSFTYESSSWYSPRPIGKNIDDAFYKGSNICFGDSGGPLIYKNQILGIASTIYKYDCEGNNIGRQPLSDRFLGIGLDPQNKEEECDKDPCCNKILYSSSNFAALIQGSNLKVVEEMIKKIEDKLL